MWQSRRTTSATSGDDFLVAGRTLPAHVLVFTLLSTWIGSGSLFGGAGLGYRVGLAALWQSAGAWVGIALIFFIAPRVRRLAQYTVPDILEMRYGPPARVLGTITIVFAYTAIAAYQFRGGGRLLNLVAGVDPDTGAIITAAFCVGFTALAGMSSVARLDVVNGVTMLVGVGAAIVYLLGQCRRRGAAAASLRPRSADACSARCRRARRWRCSCRRCACCSAKRTCIRSSSRPATSAPRAAPSPAGSSAPSSSRRLIVGIGLLGSLAVAGPRRRRIGNASSFASPSACCRRCSACCSSRRRGDHRLDRQQHAAQPGDEPGARRLPALPEPGRQRAPDRAPDAHRHRRARRPRARRGQPASRRCWRWRCGPTRCTARASRRRCSPRSSGRAPRRRPGICSIAAGMSVTLLSGTAVAAADRSAGYTPGMQTIYPALVASVGTLVGVTVWKR